MPTPLLDALRRRSRNELADLLTALAPEVPVADTEDAASLCGRLFETLGRLCGAPGNSDATLERHLVRRVATALGVDYDPEMDTAAITEAVRAFVTDAIVADLRPFIQVAVCMGWADGTLRPEEIAVLDAALSRLKLLLPFRADLLRLCAAPIAPDDLGPTLVSIAEDPQKAWSLLAFGWAVALADLNAVPAEVSAYHKLAAHLGVGLEQADRVRALVTRRFEQGLDAASRRAGGRGAARALAQATLAALHAAELDAYLQATTGLRTLSVLLARPVSEGRTLDSMGMLDAVLDRDGWVGAPTLLAGTLFLRRLGSDAEAQKLFLAVLLGLEHMRGASSGSRSA